MTAIHRLGYFLAIVLALALVGFGVVVLWRLAFDQNVQLTVGLVTLLGTVGLAIWNFNKTKEKESEARLFPQRAEVYSEVLGVLKEMISPDIVSSQKPDTQQVTRRLLDAKFRMIVWGSQKTLGAFDHIASQVGDTGDSFARMCNLLGCMRRDLGHRVTLSDCIAMMLYLLKAEDQLEARTAIIASSFYQQVLVRDFPAR